MSCNIAVRCWDNSIRYCLRPKGHTFGCNPFSNTAPTIGTEREKKDENQDIVEVVYHQSLKNAELVTT